MFHILFESGHRYSYLPNNGIPLTSWVKEMQAYAYRERYIELTATDNELEYVKAEFNGIPLPRNKESRKFSWHGNVAVIILMNLV